LDNLCIVLKFWTNFHPKTIEKSSLLLPLRIII
jgi:hypothetical protein